MARTEHVRYLVMVPNYWGIGDSPDDAVEEMLAAGGYLSDGYTLYSFKDDVIFQSVHPVLGEITYSHADGESVPDAPSSTKVNAVTALTARKHAITRALVNDDIDDDLREVLREERAEIDEMLAEVTI